MKNIKIYLKSFSQDKLLMTVFFGGVILNLISWIIFWVGLDFDKTALILHYNSFFGIDKFAFDAEEQNFLDVFFVAFGGLMIMIINYSLGAFLILANLGNKKETISKEEGLVEISISELGGYFLFWSGMILQVFILVYTVAIIFVNR